MLNPVKLMQSIFFFVAILSIQNVIAQIPVITAPRAATLFQAPSFLQSARQQALGFPSRSSQEQVRMADQDIVNWQRQQAEQQRTMDEALAALSEPAPMPAIEYDFVMYNGQRKSAYQQAFDELKKMLSGQSTLDLKRAVYLVEHAYDTALRFPDFNRDIQVAVNVIGLKMKKDRISPQDNTGKIMAAFQYMADTIRVFSSAGEKHITTYPKTYDFEDFWGRHDYRKMFVSKLLKSGSGQCHSMPLLFLILCQEIRAEAYLSFLPNHSFVKFKDNRGRWHNMELTNGILASDHKMVESGFVKAEAIRSGIYMAPMSKRETIAQCLNDLAQGYQKQFGPDEFSSQCTETVLKNYPDNLMAHQINANYFMALGQHVVAQYKQRHWTQQQLLADPKAMAIKRSVETEIGKIEQLGFSWMPEDAYAAWLKSMQNEAERQRHRNEMSLLNGMIQKR